MGAGKQLRDHRTDTAAAADFDSDGKIDVAVTDSLTSTFGVLLGNGNGTLKPVKNLTGLDALILDRRHVETAF